MTSARSASEFAAAARRFARTIVENAGEWDDEQGRRIRADRCGPIEQEVERFADHLEQVAREVAAARRCLR
jgi:F0F1-type ATP synthase membrane subunit b/b'